MGFSKIKATKFGLEKVKEDPFITVGISLAAAIYWTVPFYIIRYVLRINEVAGSLLLIFFLVLNLLILMGYIKVGIDLHDGNPVSLKDLFMHYKKLPDFLIGLLFYIVLVAFSSLFLVIPGIFVAVKFSFGLFFVLQGDGPALESLKKSWKITSGQFFNLLIFYLFLLAFNALGFAVGFIGFAFTLPISVVAVVYGYRKLSYDYRKREVEAVASTV